MPAAAPEFWRAHRYLRAHPHHLDSGHRHRRSLLQTSIGLLHRLARRADGRARGRRLVALRRLRPISLRLLALLQAAPVPRGAHAATDHAKESEDAKPYAQRLPVGGRQSRGGRPVKVLRGAARDAAHDGLGLEGRAVGESGCDGVVH